MLFYYFFQLQLLLDVRQQVFNKIKIPTSKKQKKYKNHQAAIKIWKVNA
jgi:hypothetical protein